MVVLFVVLALRILSSDVREHTGQICNVIVYGMLAVVLALFLGRLRVGCHKGFVMTSRAEGVVLRYGLCMVRCLPFPSFGIRHGGLALKTVIRNISKSCLVLPAI